MRYVLLALALALPVASGCSRSHAQDAPASGSTAAAREYTCPMHPEVVQQSPGKCPKCGMNLVPKGGAQPGGGGAVASAAGASAAHAH